MKRINFYISKIKLDFLQSLEGTVAEHLRRAVDEYIERQKAITSSGSASKVGDSNG